MSFTYFIQTAVKSEVSNVKQSVFFFQLLIRNMGTGNEDSENKFQEVVVKPNFSTQCPYILYCFINDIHMAKNEPLLINCLSVFST